MAYKVQVTQCNSGPRWSKVAAGLHVDESTGIKQASTSVHTVIKALTSLILVLHPVQAANSGGMEDVDASL